MKRKFIIATLGACITLCTSLPAVAADTTKNTQSPENSFEVLTDEELDNISLEDLKKEYIELADAYTAIQNNTTSTSNDENFDLEQFTPGQPIENIYSILGEPDSINDLGSSSAYDFKPASDSIYYYGLSDFIFSFFTDENGFITSYTFTGSCDNDSGDNIYNTIVEDFSVLYGTGQTYTNNFGGSGLEWDISNISEYSSVRLSKDSYTKTAITISFGS